MTDGKKKAHNDSANGLAEECPPSPGVCSIHNCRPFNCLIMRSFGFTKNGIVDRSFWSHIFSFDKCGSGPFESAVHNY